MLLHSGTSREMHLLVCASLRLKLTSAWHAEVFNTMALLETCHISTSQPACWPCMQLACFRCASNCLWAPLCVFRSTLLLQDELLVVDSTQQLVPAPVDQPPPRPASPPPPPGVLSMEQLAATAAAMQSAQHPAGFLAVQAATDLMLNLASQGQLGLHAAYMFSMLSLRLTILVHHALNH